jgi:undecaprenyl-diphosphatase
VTIYGGALGELDLIDQAVYRAIAATPSPSLDLILSRLSAAADHSKLWFAVAAAPALTPGGRGGPPWLGWRASGWPRPRPTWSARGYSGAPVPTGLG